MLDHVQMHVFNNLTGEWKSLSPQGRQYSKTDGSFRGRNFIYPLSLEKNDHKTIYLSVRSKSLIATRIGIWDRTQYFRQRQLDLIFFGIFLVAWLKQNSRYTCSNKLVALTVSVGVASWVPTVEGAHKQLVTGADAALYQAKGAGRNCVVCFQDSDTFVMAN